MKLISPFTLLFGLFTTMAFFAGCQQSPGTKQLTKEPGISPKDSSIPKIIVGNFSDQNLLRFDSTAIDSFVRQYPNFAKYEGELKKFYSPRNYAYAWQNKEGLIEQSSILYNQIQDRRDNGLNNNLPYLDSYAKYMEEGLPGVDPQRELMITAQYLLYAEQVLTGLPNADVDKLQWYVPRKKIDFTAILDSMLVGSSVNTDSLIFPLYTMLKKHLQKYNEIEKKGSWIVINPDKKKYALGDSSAVIAQIRKKLFLAGDISSDSQSSLYDSTIYYGIKSFQARYGLGEDGVAGPSVLKEMAAPLSKRIRQIIVNMERCRWLPIESDSNYLVVNIPQFKLSVYENHQVNWSCNVVVGKETNKTVIFKGDMKHVVLSPYWNVPPSIIKKEIAPAMKRNKNYLSSHNMEWNGGNVRQKPGPNNSLGLVKFLFPNSFNIYLHDTPSKSLFNEDRRAFSHGCIRVSEPRKLAEYLLRNDPNWPKDKIWEAMNSGKEQYVTLKPTVPVYIVYLTAFVDQNGKLNFRDDIYKRDETLANALFAKAGQ